jgi:hypothetical protein
MSDPYAAFADPVDPYAAFSTPVKSAPKAPTAADAKGQKIADLSKAGPPTSRGYREAVAKLPVSSFFRDYQGNVRRNDAGPRMLTDPKAGNPIVPVGGANDAGRGYLRGLGEGVQGILDPDNMVSILGGFVGAKPKADNQFSPLDVIQSAAYGGRALGRGMAGDASGAQRDMASVRANTGQGRNLSQGGGYVPQTASGRVGQVAGQMTPNALIPGSALARTANVVLPTAGTMAGGEIGQAVGGDTGRAVGEIVGGVAGGVAAGLRAPNAPPAAVNTPQARLQAEGIQLTPGQLMGGIARGLEDKATSIPFVGDSIRGAKVRAGEGFNRALANRVLAPLNETLPRNIQPGREMISHLQERIGQAYDDVLSRVTVQRDPQLDADIQGVLQRAAILTDQEQAQLTRAIDQVVLRRLNGQISGDDFKVLDSDIGKLASDYSSSTAAGERQLGEAFGEIKTALRDLVTRTNPQEATALGQVDQGFANLTLLERAAAKSTDGTITPAQARVAMRQGDRSVRKRASAAGRARMQGLIDDASAVLPSTVPDSGTAGRIAAMGTGYVAATNPLLAVPALGAMGVYSPPGIAAVNALSRIRPPAVAYSGNGLVPLTSGAQQAQQQQRLPR